MSYWYNAFGLRIESSIDLLGVTCPAGDAELTVTSCPLSSGSIPSGPLFWGTDECSDESVAVIPRVAKFRARQGIRVSIEADDRLPECDLRAIVISTALPLAIQQLDGLLLEASAFRWGRKVFLLVGRGPCGKSSLAALMADAGAELLADSHCMIRRRSDGTPVTDPAFPHVRLWPAQIEELIGDWPDPVPVRAGLEKRMFAAPNRFARNRLEIDGLFFLRRGVEKEFCLRRLALQETLQLLALASDRLRSSVSADRRIAWLKTASSLAALPFCHLFRWPQENSTVLESRDRLLDFLQHHHSAVPA